jgi:predicted sulfurtransferase
VIGNFLFCRATVRNLQITNYQFTNLPHGVRSLNVTNWLRQQGFEKAQFMRGGIARWSREVDPNVPTY